MHARRHAVARRGCLCLLLAGLLGVGAGCAGEDEQRESTKTGVLRLHPDNPRYLEFRGKPTVLITSGEHYGAVINADFDQVKYLDTLARHGFNLTRLFSGAYVERAKDIPVGYANTLAPRAGRSVLPWQRVGQRVDLTKWNEAYFARLRRFVREAGRRAIVVEVVFFSALYDYERWNASPFHRRNNVNGLEAIEAKKLHTLDNGGALEHQTAFVRKLVSELRSFDNVYYEISNEAFSEPAPASDAWQDRMVSTIEQTERPFGQKHLIARNYDHTTGAIREPNPSVSIFNFHYQRDVGDYADLKGVLAFDETGFQGTRDEPYRDDAWHFMLSGGGVYSNLDWSFAPGHEDGSYRYPADTPGGGGPRLRRSLAVLKRFLERFDLPRMRPKQELVTSAPRGANTRVLEDIANAYAVYVRGGRRGRIALGIEIAAGTYAVEWIDTRDGRRLRTERLDHPGGQATLVLPRYPGEAALAIEAR